MGDYNMPKFDIHASVVFQLGESLVTDDVSALIELVKNSYDADASYVLLTVNTEEFLNYGDMYFHNKGYIIIEDDGVGMDESDIKRGWLTISNSYKRQQKEKGQLTKKYRRTPLGDKGLGRLGVQRLGKNVELFTCKEGTSIEYHVGIDWSNFLVEESLYNVPIRYDRKETLKPRKGTKIVISGLRNPDAWKGDALIDLQKKLSQLIFPFVEVRPFNIFAEVNGIRLILGEQIERVLDVSKIRYQFTFDGKTLKMKGLYKISLFKPAKPSEQEIYFKIMEEDLGKGFYQYIKNSGKLDIKLSQEKGWYIEINSEQTIDSLGGVEVNDEGPVSPGPFHGRIDAFDLGDEVDDSTKNIFSKLAEFRNYIKNNAGIRVFRDGFGIRPYGIDGNDWLRLGEDWTAGKSYYGLKPRNVIGYVALTALENSMLEEKTDREGFKDTVYSRNFFRLMFALVKNINDTNEILRRGYGEFRKGKEKELAGLKRSQDVDDVYNDLRNTAKKAIILQEPAKEAITKIDEASTIVNTLNKKLTSIKDRRLKSDTEKIVTQIKETIDSTKELIVPIKEHLVETGELRHAISLLETELREVRRQLVEISELAALGLTAEALSHEINTIASNISERTRKVSVFVKSKGINEPQIRTYIEHIKSSVTALRKQLSHLAPSMKYVRESIDVFSLKEFLLESCEFYYDRFKRFGIKILIRDTFNDFKVKINKGKLTQVFDNILLNSEYWLREDTRINKVAKHEIIIDASQPFVYFWDNGIGIDPSIENKIFEPFITNKPKGKGRGLGLFIVQQLLDSSGCTINLKQERNIHGRRYIFQIDLSGVLCNE